MTALSPAGERRSWSVGVRAPHRPARAGWEDSCADRQPAYVASWIYVFGVLTISALVVVVASGLVLHAGRGGVVAHVRARPFRELGAPVECRAVLIATMVIHLWGTFWMAAWRGRRGLTWVTGVVAFVASIATAFTGYLTQSNFDSQWISGEAKDGINSIGVGAFFNVLDPSQMLMWHIVLFPLPSGSSSVRQLVPSVGTALVPPLDRRAAGGDFLTA